MVYEYPESVLAASASSNKNSKNKRKQQKQQNNKPFTRPRSVDSADYYSPKRQLGSAKKAFLRRQKQQQSSLDALRDQLTIELRDLEEEERYQRHHLASTRP